MSRHDRRPPPRYERGSEEFSRVLAFSDGVFAIAMTLLVVGITVPTIQDTDDVGELADALNDLIPNFVSFFISFAVIGRYWAAHHQSFSNLAAVDRGLIGINLVFLAFVAFLPFPTALLGSFFENPLSIVTYASTVAVVSGMEVVEFRHAFRRGLFQKQVPGDVYRWGVLVSTSPVAFFVLSIPVAFVSTGLAAGVWFLRVPWQAIANRWKPEAADEYLS
jgi:uncharacterized membrane protein